MKHWGSALFPLSLLLVLAGLTFWLRYVTTFDEPRRDGKHRHDPDYIVTDAVVRLLPGVLGDEQSAADESFSHGLLEYPHYTRPAEFRRRSSTGHAPRPTPPPRGCGTCGPSWTWPRFRRVTRRFAPNPPTSKRRGRSSRRRNGGGRFITEPGRAR